MESRQIERPPPGPAAWQLRDARISEVGPVDGSLGEIQSDEIVADSELPAINHFAVRRLSIFQRSDLRFFAGLPSMAGNHAGSMRTYVICVGLFISVAVQRIEACKAHYDGDGKTFLMPAIEVVIERHLRWTLALCQSYVAGRLWLAIQILPCRRFGGWLELVWPGDSKVART